MTIFYDPKQKKVKIWTFILLAFVPVILLGLGWLLTQEKVETTQKQKTAETAEKTWDNF
jgi:hypothetical protein